MSLFFSPTNVSFLLVGIDAFDFGECHHNITLSKVGVVEKLLIPPVPWTPCLWNVTIPRWKNVYVSCIAPNDREVKTDRYRSLPWVTILRLQVKTDCKGYFTIYASGKFEDGQLYCSDKAFSVEDDGNRDGNWSDLLITYSGQEHRDPFNCTLVAFDNTCEVNMELNLKSAKDFVELQLPYFPTDTRPWYSCTWNITAPKKPISYGTILECYLTETALKKKEEKDFVKQFYFKSV